MASTEYQPTGISESSGNAEAGATGMVEGDGRNTAKTLNGTTNSEGLEKVRTPVLVDLSTLARPVPAIPSPASASGSGHGTVQLKKFSAVNINKKFLEKNSSTSGSIQSSSHSPAVKSNGPTQRPTVQQAASLSRLVTTKLTVTQTSTTPGPGWSRSPSAAPSSASPSSTVNPNPPPVVSSTAAPQLPHVGKVIQPQPRAAIQTPAVKESSGGPSKPVWGNLKTSPITVPKLQDDFPTAAEVAQVTSRKLKPDDVREQEIMTSEQHARAEEADTFRGVHLDPNAHHWDEMEEDDDNFLDGVIEFGDGRQYKIQTTDATTTSPSLLGPSGESPDAGTLLTKADESIPVSKEERFAEDFDRSWPRSNNSPAILQKDVPFHSQHTVPSSPASSQAAHSPKESSRVLFNERSNRLEPYSHVHRPGPGPGPFPPKRPPHPDFTASARDAPPHSSGFQLLQKGSGTPNSFSRPRGLSGSGFQGGDRSRRDNPSPQLPLDGSEHHRSRDLPPIRSPRDREFPSDNRVRRSSNTMGPPPLPHSLLDQSKDSGRQLPPHLSQMPPLPRRVSSREPHPRPPSSSHEDSNYSGLPMLQSPAQSHSSLTVSDSPVTVPGVDIDEVRKAAMHSAAERAKQRRQQEEEEREIQKERARKKAAEIEARMKASEAESATSPPVEDAEVIEIIEEAVRDIVSTPQSALPPSGKTTLPRSPSLRPTPHQPFEPSRPQPPNRRTSNVSNMDPPPPVPSSTAESWRSKASPLPTRAPPLVQPPSAPPPPPHPSIDSFAIQTEGEELETIDFSELGKLVGVSDTLPDSQASEMPNKPLRASRPVASDFFDDRPSTVTSKSDASSWRRKPSDNSTSGSPQAEDSSFSKETPELNGTHIMRPTESLTLPLATMTEHPQESATIPQRVSRVSISAIDDAMSRIRGAMQQATEHNRTGSGDQAHAPLLKPSGDPSGPSVKLDTSRRESKWVTPALKSSKIHDFDPQPQEIFNVTVSQTPRSPKPAWKFNVRLPSTSSPRERVAMKQLSFMHNGRSPLEVLSWNLPPRHMHRDFSLNDILFPIPKNIRGKFKYQVTLPNVPLGTKAAAYNSPGMTGPKVHLPSSPVSAKTKGGAFGRSSNVNDQLTWRKSSNVPSEDTIDSDSGLNTVSRSPPPELTSSSNSVTSTVASNTRDMLATRSRTQPKMPAGSAVAFYRDSKIDIADSDIKPAVNFIVHSELEEKSHSQTVTPPEPVVSPASTGVSTIGSVLKSDGKAVRPVTRELKPYPDSPDSSPSLVQSKGGSKSSSDSTPMTPPSHPTSATWTKSPLGFSVKDSPARPPDREHLKAVWSQASDKARLPVINSLEGIGDDLTALPFTLQDVKSEDGETPPPVPAAPSRMSLHDVTRAFQQAPPSPPGSAVHRVIPLSPGSTTVSTRPTTFTYPLPRSPYPGYPGPVMSHSPSPSLIYPHHMAPSPVPARLAVSGHTPMYNQPLWVPLPGPAGQNHGPMMRPIASPYPAQVLPYPSPNNGSSMYGHGNVPNAVSHQQNGGPQTRGHGMPMMSPVMSHANVQMYTGSPIIMHTPVMHVPPGSSYIGPIRGQMRSDSIHTPHTPNGHPPPHTTGLPPTSFTRPSW